MATYNDPYSNTGHDGSRYQNYQSNDNTPYYSNQAYDSTGPTYDPYSQVTAYNTQHNAHFDSTQDDLQKEEVAPALPSKYGDDEDSFPARKRSTRTTGAASALNKKNSLSVAVAPVRKHWNGFEQGEFTPATRGKGKTARALKEYRYDARGNLWNKGSRARCFGRFFCCTVMLAVLVIVSVILALALWVRPPAVTIGQVVTQNTTGSLSSADGLSINLSVNITVDNPNYFGVDFTQIKAEIFYPINNVPMGGGEATNVVFKSRSTTEFNFPFALTYKSSDDPGNAVFVDLGTKCGLGGGTKSDITVNYKITLGIKFLVIVVKPVISNSFSFTCPSSLLGGGIISGTSS